MIRVLSDSNIMKDKKGVIFDLDGTLVDSMWMWKEIDIEFLGRYGYDCPDDLQKAIEGMSFSETAVYFKNRFNLSETTDEIKDIWTEMSIDKYRYEVPLKPGAKEFLDYLKDNDIPCGIATSNNRIIVDALLDSLKIEDYFDVVSTACEVNAGKPEPDIYLKVASLLGVDPKDCLVFEDVAAGITAGKRAGMTVCAVKDPYAKESADTIRSMADHYIDDFYELSD